MIQPDSLGLYHPASDDEIIELMKCYVTIIEQKIRKDPTQWLMFREFGIEFENMYPHAPGCYDYASQYMSYITCSSSFFIFWYV